VREILATLPFALERPSQAGMAPFTLSNTNDMKWFQSKGIRLAAATTSSYQSQAMTVSYGTSCPVYGSNAVQGDDNSDTNNDYSNDCCTTDDPG
jgi:hypothetical protein